MGTNHKMTPREWEVANLLADGLTLSQIADRTGIAYRTVKQHSDGARRVAGVSNMAQLVTYIWQNRTKVKEATGG